MRAVQPALALRHPIWWGALVLLIVNDHLLKGSGLLPGWMTGKLSDVAGLVVLPVIVALVLRARERWMVGAAALVVALWFASVNTVPACARAWEGVMATIGVPWRLWCDPTDLLALPAVLVSAWLMLRAEAPQGRRRVVVERALAIAGAVSCMATSVAAPTNLGTAQGVVLAQDYGSGVYVIDSSTGRRLATSPFGAGASVIVDRVVYGVSGNSIRGIDVQNDTEVVSYEHEEEAFHSHLLTDGSRLFLITKPSGRKTEKLVAFDVRTKKVAWSVSLPSHEHYRLPPKQPILAGGLVVVPAGNELIAFDPGTGRRRWKHVAASALSWPATEGRAVFVVDEEGVIASIDLELGTTLWTHAVGTAEGFDVNYGRRLGAGNNVLAFVRGRRLVGIASDTRTPRWKGPEVHDAVIGSSIALARLEGDDGDSWVAIRLIDGKQLWKLDASDWLRWAPTIDEENGLVLFRTDVDELRAFVAATGASAWRFLLDDGERTESTN